MNEVNKQFCPVILAGGGGTRLWPLSREHYPKQFLSFVSENSMLQQTLLRVCTIKGPLMTNAPILICNEEHRFLVEEHATEIGITPSEIILEPSGRNTAPALTIAAFRTLQDDPVLLITPADHLVSDVEHFQKAIGQGYLEAMEGKRVTLVSSLRDLKRDSVISMSVIEWLKGPYMRWTVLSKSPIYKRRLNILPQEIISGTVASS